MYIPKIENPILTPAPKVLKRHTHQDESFQEAMQEVLTADAVEVTHSSKDPKDEQKETRQQTKQQDSPPTPTPGNLNITA